MLSTAPLRELVPTVILPRSAKPAVCSRLAQCTLHLICMQWINPWMEVHGPGTGSWHRLLQSNTACGRAARQSPYDAHSPWLPWRKPVWAEPGPKSGPRPYIFCPQAPRQARGVRVAGYLASGPAEAAHLALRQLTHTRAKLRGRQFYFFTGIVAASARCTHYTFHFAQIDFRFAITSPHAQPLDSLVPQARPSLLTLHMLVPRCASQRQLEYLQQCAQRTCLASILWTPVPAPCRGPSAAIPGTSPGPLPRSFTTYDPGIGHALGTAPPHRLSRDVLRRPSRRSRVVLRPHRKEPRREMWPWIRRPQQPSALQGEGNRSRRSPGTTGKAPYVKPFQGSSSGLALRQSHRQRPHMRHRCVHSATWYGHRLVSRHREHVPILSTWTCTEMECSFHCLSGSPIPSAEEEYSLPGYMQNGLSAGSFIIYHRHVVIVVDFLHGTFTSSLASGTRIGWPRPWSAPVGSRAGHTTPLQVPNPEDPKSQPHGNYALTTKGHSRGRSQPESAPTGCCVGCLPVAMYYFLGYAPCRTARMQVTVCKRLLVSLHNGECLGPNASCLGALLQGRLLSTEGLSFRGWALVSESADFSTHLAMPAQSRAERGLDPRPFQRARWRPDGTRRRTAGELQQRQDKAQQRRADSSRPDASVAGSGSSSSVRDGAEVKPKHRPHYWEASGCGAADGATAEGEWQWDKWQWDSYDGQSGVKPG